MKYRKRSGLVPPEHMGAHLSERAIPPGLSQTVDVTIWKDHGDHAAVEKEENLWHADGTVVMVQGGMVELYRGRPAIPASQLAQNGVIPAEGARYFQLEPVHGVVHTEDEASGKRVSHIVKPGYAIVRNDSDGKVWAISPQHLAAWFEPVE